VVGGKASSTASLVSSLRSIGWKRSPTLRHPWASAEYVPHPTHCQLSCQSHVDNALTKPTHLQALYAYEAENEYELSIQVGEILTVETEDEGWYCGTNSKNQYGRFPSNFCEPLK